MSYCRVSPNSDVYMYDSGYGKIDCDWCDLTERKAPGFFPPTVTLTSREEAMNHLLEHRKAGHLVPQYAIDRLQNEIDNKEPPL